MRLWENSCKEQWVCLEKFHVNTDLEIIVPNFIYLETLIFSTCGTNGLSYSNTKVVLVRPIRNGVFDESMLFFNSSNNPEENCFLEGLNCKSQSERQLYTVRTGRFYMTLLQSLVNSVALNMNIKTERLERKCVNYGDYEKSSPRYRN